MKIFRLALFILGHCLAIKTRTSILEGNLTLGYYYINVFVGTPPQPKTLIIDTGSYLTVFPCQGCINCGSHETPLFKIDDSSSFSYLTSEHKNFGWKCVDQTKNHCHYQQRYFEGSEYMGYYAKDYFQIDSKTKKRDQIIFGCVLSETNDFFNQKADGIIGLGIIENSDTIPPSPVEILHQTKAINSNSFAILLAESRGQLRFGGWNSEFHDPSHQIKIVDCSHTDWSSQYQMDLTSISVD